MVSPEQLLEFERAHAVDTPGRKADAARRELGVSLPRYYQLLRTVLSEPAALEHDAVLAHHTSDRWRGLVRRRSELIFGRRRPR